MPQDDITLKIIDDVSGKSTDFHFSWRGLKYFVVFAILIFFYGINLLWDCYKMKKELVALIPSTKILKGKNDVLEEQIKGLNGKIRLLNKDILVLKEYDKILKDKFALNRSNIGHEGMGGTEEEIKVDDLILKFNNALEEYSEDVLRPLDSLKQEAFEQKESFEELIKFLNTQDSKLRATPAIWPVRGYMTSGFGYRISPFSGRLSFHKGLDIAGQKGLPVRVTADGIVIFSGWQEGYGKLVVVDHGYGYWTFYAHNSRLLVDKWQRVKRRDVISLMGSTGHSTGPHLHYEVHVNNKVENPYNFILE